MPRLTCSTAAILLAVPGALAAQTGTVSGSIVDAATGAPLSGAIVRVVSAAGDTLGPRPSNRQGSFSVAGLSPGRYDLLVNRLGYRPVRLGGVLVPDQGERSISMEALPLSLQPIVVSAALSEQLAFDAPASVSAVDHATIERATVTSPVDHIQDLAGVAMVTGGLVQRKYSVRGAVTGNSNQLRTLVDYRPATVPSLGTDVPYALSFTDDDVQQIELVRGPAAALWGIKTQRGVLHVVTRSPFESPGTTVSLTGGERSFVQGSLRHAAVLSDRLAFKGSIKYTRGDDWPSPDSIEAARRDGLIAGGADPDTLLLGLRDYGIELISGDLRVDWRPDDRTEVITSGGIGHMANVFDLTSFGGNAIQLRDWSTLYVQGRLMRGRLFANVFLNQNLGGDGSYITGNAFPVFDHSHSVTGQVHHGFDVGDRQRFLYGAEVQRTISKTGGTLHASTEDTDNLTEAGVFLHSETALTPQFDAIASARLDYHSVFDGIGVSPNLALVFKPQPGHALRLTYGRGAYTPSNGSLFTDFPVARLGPLPYNLRFVGGYQDHTFRRDCDGVCMRSPFNPGGTDEYLPADATRSWEGIVEFLQQRGVDLSGLPAPDATQVGSRLGVFNVNTGGFDPITEADIVDFSKWRRAYFTTIEAGYKAVIGRHASIGLDVHFDTWSPLFGPRQVSTPSVFYDRATLEGYLAAFMPQAQAAQLAGTIAAIPVGTISPQEAADPTGLQLVQQMGGSVNYWGLDFAATVNLTDQLSASVSYGFVSEDSIPEALPQMPFVLSNPKHRGSLAVGYAHRTAGVTTDLRARYRGSYPAQNGALIGRMEAHFLLDAAVGYRLPLGSDIVISVSATNLLDRSYRQLPGLPQVGRLVLTRVRANF